MLLNDFYTLTALQHSEGNVIAMVALNADHNIFIGHFPSNPIVPGVCLMTITKEVLEQAMDQSLLLREAKSVKFLGVVNPNENKELVVKVDYHGQEDGQYKTSATITAGETVCYKANAIYAISLL